MMMVYNNLEFDEISKETDGDYIKTNTFRYINLYNCTDTSVTFRNSYFCLIIICNE